MTTINSSKQKIQIDRHSGKIPHSVQKLCELCYLEHSIHRMLCGWGNQFYAWDDKVAVCSHVWDQACIVESLRNRISQFPGVTADQPVSAELESLVNTVLCAADFEDAIDGIYQIVNTVLVNRYLDFIEQVSAIHDAPTHQIIRQIVATKDLQRRWRSEYRQRVAHTTDSGYLKRISEHFEKVEYLKQPTIFDKQKTAAPLGVNTTFRPLAARIDPTWQTRSEHDVLDWIAVDFANQIEARQLFWPIGYMRELGLAMSQLHWIYDSPDMPWAFHFDESRHLWDESRHGDSGYTRMKELGITINEVGFTHSRDLLGNRETNCDGKTVKPILPTDLYESLFFIGMIAETGHFKVKREAYADFRDGGDLASAEMMLYDIIDETMHVQYAHQWLPALAKRAALDHTGYEQRASQIRKQKQLEADNRVATLKQKQKPNHESDPTYQLYMTLRDRVRSSCPLSNAASCPIRSAKPM
ncbi:MAG TPA: hypothetical protein DCM28_02615 [Phycisphaerales bacterium]|nr:hypothetical protein [Phycisphaerales bacterium]HCD32225.1 hypothetical protein [Phycisphaerales bacterium]